MASYENYARRFPAPCRAMSWQKLADHAKFGRLLGCRERLDHCRGDRDAGGTAPTQPLSRGAAHSN
jgi:hypothetical protein